MMQSNLIYWFYSVYTPVQGENEEEIEEGPS
jgi:hypothetical protein